MERLKSMKEALVSCVQNQISGNLAQVNTEELGDAIDMIKDLEEAIYYRTITKSMEESEKESKHQPMYYPVPMYYPPRDIDRYEGRMYYDGISSSSYTNGNNGSNGGSNRNYSEPMMPYYDYPAEMMRDAREGRSPMSRKNYMEAKEMKKDDATKMKELEKYLQELGHDITEMIQDAAPEEKKMLQQKISLLATKIK